MRGRAGPEVDISGLYALFRAPLGAPDRPRAPPRTAPKGRMRPKSAQNPSQDPPASLFQRPILPEIMHIDQKCLARFPSPPKTPPKRGSGTLRVLRRVPKAKN